MSAGFSVLIPARMASSRLPDKPLADLAGLPMVVRVAHRAAASGARQVVVATDDDRVLRACEQHGVSALMTRRDHASGSDRLAEACTLLGLDGDDLVVNVQGDEPLIEPALLHDCAALLARQADCVMSTVAHPISAEAELRSPHVVKVVLDAAGRALYFSRALIPHWRDAPADTDGPAPRAGRPAPPVLRHLGLYAYRAAFLRRFPTLPPSPLEQCEALEQLRVLWHGHRIAVHVATEAGGPGVDTPEDLARVRQWLAAEGGGSPG